MTNYPIGDFLIQIKNAAHAGKREVQVSSSKLIKEVAEVLKKERILESVEIVEGKVKVKLGYMHKQPTLLDLRIVSKPGLRVYKNKDELGKKRGASTYIVSTSQGVMTLKEVLKKGVGGEVIAEIW